MTVEAFKTIGDLVFGSPTFRLWMRDFHKSGPALFKGIDPTDEETFVLLSPYTGNRPRKFFDSALYEEALALLKTVDGPRLTALCQEVGVELDSALQELRQINRLSDEAPTLGVPIEARDEVLRQRVFQLYARLAESVYDGLLPLFLATRILQDRVPSSVPSDLSGRWNMARRRLGAAFAATYSSTIRNAIVHGGVQFSDFEIHFIDKGGIKETLEPNEAAQLNNRLLDTCNALAAALAHRIALGDSGSLPALLYFRGERVLNPSTTPFLSPFSCRLVRMAGERLQVNVHGQYRHWRRQDLLLDVVRTLVLARRSFPEATHVWVNFDGPRGTPCYFNVDASQIPTTSDPISAISETADVLSKSGVAWIEHERLFDSFAARFDVVSHVLNWYETVDRKMDFGDSNPDFELRHLKNNSVGWRARFDAAVVSRPRRDDLDDAGQPTERYLGKLFNECFFRWAMRPASSRPWGVSRVRVFRSGIVSVYLQDGRLHQLLNSGLVNNFLFRFEWPLGPPVIRALFGGKMIKIGGYHVAVNPNALPVLSAIRTGTPIPPINTLLPADTDESEGAENY